MYKLESLILDDSVRQSSGEKFATLPTCITHYKVEGEGNEWAVLVHGYATPLFIYDKIAESLVNNGYKVLRYDLPGRGLSERVDKTYNHDLFATNLEELVNYVIGSDSFYLVGTSMGGAIVTAYTARHPERVKKLVLLAPAGMVFNAPFYMKLSNIKGIGDLIFGLIGVKVLTKNTASEMIYSGEEVKNAYTEQFAYYAQYKGLGKATLSSLRNVILRYDISTENYRKVAESGIPVLTIWGTDDKTMPYYQAKTMQEVLPKMKLITYEKSGHIFLYDEGERTSKDILEFLKK